MTDIQKATAAINSLPSDATIGKIIAHLGELHINGHFDPATQEEMLARQLGLRKLWGAIQWEGNRDEMRTD